MKFECCGRNRTGNYCNECGKKAPRQVACHQCGRSFVWPGRSDRIYCTDACMLKAYRVRQKEAFAMHSRGWHISRIAVALDTAEETATCWIEKARQRKRRPA